MNCDQVKQLLEAYALGALEPHEQAEVERHLAVCPDCQHLAAGYGDLVHTLPQGLAAASPLQLPPAVKNRLFQALEGTSRASTPSASTDLHLPEPSQPAPTRRPHFARWRWRPIATIAVTVLLVIFVAWNIRLSVALAQERALRAEFANLVSQQELVLEVVDSGETNRDVLRSPDSESRAYGKLFTRPDMPYLVAMAARLSPPPAGQAYHLWLIQESQPDLAGEMNVNEDGFGLLIFEADQTGPAYEAAQLTLQPEGSVAPAGDPVLIWPTSP